MSDKYSFVAATADEVHLLFANSTQDQALIGHLRGDFGRGHEFWTTWWEQNKDLKTDAFSTELDDLVNTLREDGPLADFDAMAAFCYDHPEPKLCLQGGRDMYGFRFDTQEHRYYLKCIPQSEDYNFYPLCYRTELFRDYTPKALTQQTPIQRKKGKTHER